MDFERGVRGFFLLRASEWSERGGGFSEREHEIFFVRMIAPCGFREREI